MFKRILVPLDGSRLAERALEPAQDIARPQAGQLLLLRVCAPEEILVPDIHSYGGYGMIWPDQAMEQSMREAREYLGNIRKASDQVQHMVLEGDVADAIVNTAASEQVDLIVMSSHGYSGLTRWLLGSVAERVLHSAACPVLVMRQDHRPEHVLIPLDGSELSERALAPGLSVAASLGARVTLLRASPHMDPDEIRRLDEIEHGMGLRLQREMLSSAEDYLQGLANTRAPAGLPVEVTISQGAAAASILRYAETHQADLIIMSTHGRTGLRRWVYGSVTEKVLRGGNHSMLVIRPPEHHEPQA